MAKKIKLKNVEIDRATSKFPYRGCKVYMTNTVSLSNGTTLKFSNSSITKTKLYDTDGLWNSSTGLITIPSGISKIKVSAKIHFGGTNAYAGGWIELYLLKNGTYNFQGGNINKAVSLATDMNVCCYSEIIDVVQGDTIDYTVYNGTGYTRTLGNTSTINRFPMIEVEIVE